MAFVWQERRPAVKAIVHGLGGGMAADRRFPGVQRPSSAHIPAGI